MIKDNDEKTRHSWGVEALPWLILTDKKHIVQVEGFSTTELDAKIQNINHRQESPQPR